MSGVKGKSGRKKMSVHRANTLNIIIETSPEAAAFLKKVVKGEEKADPQRLDACKFIINHDLGLPKAKTEITGADGDAIPISFVSVARPVESLKEDVPSDNQS